MRSSPLPAALPSPSTHKWHVCVLWGMKMSEIGTGNFQLPWNQTSSSGEELNGISFAGRGREWEAERIQPDSIVLTEKGKNNQRSYQWNLVILVVHMRVRRLNAFVVSVHHLELKQSFHLGSKTRYWFSDWTGKKDLSCEGKNTMDLTQPQTLECSSQKQQQKNNNKRTHTPKHVLGKPKYCALCKEWLKKQQFWNKKLCEVELWNVFKCQTPNSLFFSQVKRKIYLCWLKLFCDLNQIHTKTSLML